MTRLPHVELAGWAAEHPPTAKVRRAGDGPRDIAAKIENIRVSVPTPLLRCQAVINLAALGALDVAEALGLEVEASTLTGTPRPAPRRTRGLPWHRRV